MSEDGKRDASARRRRVQRLKKMILYTLLAMILLPFVCCIVLLVQVIGLNARVNELSGQIAQLEQTMEQVRDAMRVPQEQMEFNAAAGVKEVPDTEPLPLNAFPEELSGRRKDAELPAHMVYLTFDDGPSVYTGKILDILAEYDVKATFFVTGKEDENSQAAIKRIVEEGHALGMHSYSHKYSELYASRESFETDFYKLQDYLYGLTGVESRIYRFPGGSSNTVSGVNMNRFADFLDSRGIVFYDWNISSGDGSKYLLSKEKIITNCTSDLEKWQTVVILMHDSADKPTTVEALPAVIEKILAMEDTVILPITEDTRPVQHIQRDE